jgi:hypothetical protein
VAPWLVQDHFEFGLEVILNGLQQRLAEKQAEAPGAGSSARRPSRRSGS